MTNQASNLNQKSTAKNQNNRAHIVTAAYRLLAEKGCDAATMKEIAGAAGVASGLIHYYFASKDDLLREVLIEAGSDTLKRSSSGVRR